MASFTRRAPLMNSPMHFGQARTPLPVPRSSAVQCGHRHSHHSVIGQGEVRNEGESEDKPNHRPVATKRVSP
jgi:hypothetical protein